MPREKEGFRDNLERLDQAFPGREIISAADVADFTGLHITTVRKIYPIKPRIGISKVALARALS